MRFSVRAAIADDTTRRQSNDKLGTHCDTAVVAGRTGVVFVIHDHSLWSGVVQRAVAPVAFAGLNEVFFVPFCLPCGVGANVPVRVNV